MRSPTLDPMPEDWQRLLATWRTPTTSSTAPPGARLRAMTIEPSRALGVKHAVAFGRVQLTGV